MKLLICTQVVDKNHPILGFFVGWILEFAQHFAEVHVICLEEGIHDLPENVHVYSLGKEQSQNKFLYVLRFYLFFWKIFFNVKVDYVFFHMGAIYNILAAPFFVFRKLQGTKFYWWKTHGHINAMGRTALFFVDRVYTAIAESFPVVTKKKRVVGHAIDVSLFTPQKNKSATQTILFVGRFSRSKRLEQVLKILHELRGSGYAATARFVGQVVDPAYFAEVEAVVDELGLEEFVTFVKGVPHEQLVNEYRSATIFINPSDNDGLDKVVLEAMACGTIPLTANRSFDAVLSRYDLYMQKGHIEGYVAAGKRIFDMSETEYTALATQLRDEVVTNHSITTLSQRIFSVS